MHAQETDDTLKLLTEHKQYKKIIEDYSKTMKLISKSIVLHRSSVLYVGRRSGLFKIHGSFYSEKQSRSRPLFIKASTLNYMGKYDDAIKHFKEANKIKS